MRRIVLSLLLICLTAPVWALRPQCRAVVVDTICHAPVEKLHEIANTFARQFQACPDSLFMWAYVGIQDSKPEETKSKDSRSAILLTYKDRIYDPDHKIGDVTVDIYVLGVRWWKDQHLGTQCFVERPGYELYPVTTHLMATYSGSILQGGHYIMVLEPISPTETRVHYEFSLTFGKVLSAFISDHTWHNAIEWRFRIILTNLIAAAERGTLLP